MADFSQALIWLEQGKNVRLSSWRSIYIYLDVDIIRYADNEWYSPSYGSLKSNDWEIYNG